MRNEEWLSARLDGIQSGLRLGDHARSVPVLAELAARNPLDEGIAALLMLTLIP